MHRLSPIQRSTRPTIPPDWQSCALVSVLLCVWVCGCRAIGRIGESNQALTARKLSRQGVEAMRRGQAGAAERLFGDALEVSDADDRAHRGLAEALWNREEYQQAILHMEKAVALSAGDPRLLGRLGQMYLQVGRIDEAEQQSRLALESERNSAEIWTLEGDCLRTREKSQQALAAYHRALAIQPDLIDVKLRIAELYLLAEKHDRLLATLDGIGAELDDSQIPGRVHLMRGIAMRHLGRRELAIRHFQQAIERDPAAAEPHLQIAATELESGRTQLAHQSIARALDLDRPLVVSTGWSELLPSDRPVQAASLR
ncbi:MAG: tetratricopeptide repeat protein [Planctomycetota bacterium]